MASSQVGIYIEEEPTVKEWLLESLPATDDVLNHVFTVFPAISWIRKYNLQWLVGDLIAGITIGSILIPQSMAYAHLAGLAPQFGLFSSFAGGITYWMFGTSKDISLGPIAVMSLFTATAIEDLRQDHPDWKPHIIASAMALMAGTITATLGLMRLGWVVDFVSHTAVSAFTTGAALTIGLSQVPALLGIHKVHESSPFEIVVHIFTRIKQTRLDAAIGFSALIALYGIRFLAERMGQKRPNQKKFWFFASCLRSVLVILVFTVISFVLNRHRRHNEMFRLVGHVPAGFGDIGVPSISKSMVTELIGYMPVAIMLLLLEHVACGKSFGRMNNYQIDPSQEMLGVGIANIIGCFFGAFAATGSFSRSAVNAKAGVRTPMGGAIASVFVIIAVFALPALFYYIPDAALAAVIIHAVGDLITPWQVIKQFWKISPLEVIMFAMSVLIMIFLSIEAGVYAAIVSSIIVLLVRMARSNGSPLGVVDISPVVGQQLPDYRTSAVNDISVEPLAGSDTKHSRFDSDTSNRSFAGRSVFVPLDHSDGSNPEVQIRHPYPGVFVFRMSEGFAYPNASLCTANLMDAVFRYTRQTELITEQKPGDLAWNQVESFNKRNKRAANNLPTLKAIIIDFSSVNNVDITSVHALVDAREYLARYAAPNKVQWHFACIYNRWTKRALTSVGFGRALRDDPTHIDSTWRPLFNITDLNGDMIDDLYLNEKEAAMNKKNEVEVVIEDNTSTVLVPATAVSTISIVELSSSSSSGGSGTSTPKLQANPSPLRTALRGDWKRQDSSFAVRKEETVVAVDKNENRSGTTGSDASTARGVVEQRAVAGPKLLLGLNWPFFHVDVLSALQSVMHNIELAEDSLPESAV